MGCHICTLLTYRARLSGTVERVGRGSSEEEYAVLV